jgi:hypothetical protein
MLIVEHQHAVGIHAGLDRRRLVAGQGLGDVDAGNIADEARMHRMHRMNGQGIGAGHAGCSF